MSRVPFICGGLTASSMTSEPISSSTRHRRSSPGNGSNKTTAVPPAAVGPNLEVDDLAPVGAFLREVLGGIWATLTDVSAAFGIWNEV
jgi:hypothetical protein